MDRTNSINLFEHIQSLKGYNRFIVFMTYNFDPIFFDGTLLRTLRRNCGNAPILVLMDSSYYTTIRKEFTNDTGNGYLLVPFRPADNETSTLFHPKLFLFIGEEKQQVILGSHNLTLQGFSNNLETCYVSEDTRVVANCIDYLHEICQMCIDKNNPIMHQIDELRQKQSHGSGKSRHPLEILSNLHKPILDQVLSRTRTLLGHNIDEVMILSPYFSDVVTIVSRINQHLSPKTIRLCVQPGNHNLNTKGLSKFGNLQLHAVAPRSDKNRRIHAKWISFTSKNRSVLVFGSPNFTRPAFIELAGDRGNYELAAFLQDIDSAKLWAGMLEDKISSAADVDKSARTVEPPTNKISEKFQIYIEMAFVDNLRRTNLQIMSSISDNLEVLYHDVPTKEEIACKVGRQMIKVSGHTAGDVSIAKDGKLISNTMRLCKIGGSLYSSVRCGDSNEAVAALTEVRSMDDVALIVSSYFGDLVRPEKVGGGKGKTTSVPIDLPGRLTQSGTPLDQYDLIIQTLLIGGKRPPHNGFKHQEAKLNTSSAPPSTIEKVHTIIERLSAKLKAPDPQVQQNISRYSFYAFVIQRVLSTLQDSRDKSALARTALDRLAELMRNHLTDYHLTSQRDEESFFLALTCSLITEGSKSIEEPYQFEQPLMQFLWRIISERYFNEEDPAGQIEANIYRNLEGHKMSYDLTLLRVTMLKLLALSFAAVDLDKKKTKIEQLLVRISNTSSSENSLAFALSQKLELYLSYDSKARHFASDHAKLLLRKKLSGTIRMPRFVESIFLELAKANDLP